MVIISKDDYLSFLSEIGERMQTPPVNPNNQLTTASATTFNFNKRLDSANAASVVQLQPPLPQAQQHLQQNTLTQINNSSNGNNKPPQVARANLICRQNSHPFQNRTLFLQANQEVKIGRAVARTKATDTNAIFDCKVLSRNHAIIWYTDGKFFLKDTGSSNGTFINNNRLSETSTQSEPFEVSSGDIVQFGVDVMENSRKETHGCIVATLKLFLPDGRETKASHSTMVGAVSTKIEPSDLYRLNQYVQEIVQRDQIMESKLLNIQKTVDSTRKNSQSCWQAFIDEDRLLSRIDMLEKKLQCMQKNVTEDKLREEVMKLQEEKLVYQNTAKEALSKAYKERAESIQRLTAIQRALCSSEDECSLLRDQITKLNQQIQELTENFSTVQKQFDEKITEAQEKETKKEAEMTALKEILKVLQDRLRLLQESYDSDASVDSSGNKEKLASLLMNSNIKNLDDSVDVIEAIWNENKNEDNADISQTCDNSTAKIYKKIVHLESIVSLLKYGEPTNIDQMNLEAKNDSNVLNENAANLNATDEKNSVCDGNQNLNVDSNPMLASTIDSKILKKAIKNLKNSFIDLMKENEKSSNNMEMQENAKLKEDDSKTLTEDLEKQITSLKQELDSRPCMKDYKQKVDLIDELNDKLTLSETENLAFKLELNTSKSKIGTLQHELEESKKHAREPPEIAKLDAFIQTDLVSIVEEIQADHASASETKPNSIGASVNGELDTELKIIHHPDLQREEELVAFKEKYSKLVEEKLEVDKELVKLREEYQQFKNKSVVHLLLYLAPFIALISYLIFYYTN